MGLNELQWVEGVVTSAQRPEEVFESLRRARVPLGERLSSLDGDFRRLSGMCNPEHFASAPAIKERAEAVRARLLDWYQEALARVDAEDLDLAGGGPYRSPARPAPSQTAPTLRTAQGLYRLSQPLARGDLASLYLGECEAGSWLGDAVVLKIANDAGDNDLLGREVAALGRLWASEGPQRKHIPRLLDRALSPDGKAGNILSVVEGRDLLYVRARYPGGVPGEHAVWMLRRLLSVVGYAHSLGVLHGNIEPAHVLVRAHDHNISLVDWCYAVVDPSKTGQRFACLNPDYSAPELAKKQAPHPSADLFSVGKCALFLLGGDLETGALPAQVEDKLQRFVRWLIRPSALQRAQDAWEAFEELGRIRKALYGAHRFQEFPLD